MRNRPRVPARRGTVLGLALVVAVGVIVGPVAGLAVAFAVGLVAFASSLPGAAPDGLLVGSGLPLVSMIGWHHPGHRAAMTAGCVLLAVAALLRVRAWRPRERGYATLGAFWMAVPVAACAVVAAAVGPLATFRIALARVGSALVEVDSVLRVGGPARWGGHRGDIAARAASLLLVVAVLALVVAAARRRSRDVSVGVVAGLLWALAVLFVLRADRVFAVLGSRDVRLTDGRLLGWPADLVGLGAVAVAGRIGPDRAFARRQRWTSLALAVALLLVAGSATAFASALVAALAYAVFAARRETGTRGSLRLAWRAADSRRAILRAAVPVGLLGVLVPVAVWLGRAGPDWSGRPGGVGGLLPAWREAGVAGWLFGAGPWLGALAGAALLAGAARVLWRLTGPGLPLWVPVVGLGALVSALFGGTSGSPAWLLVACAELWVVCRSLRTDRDAPARTRSSIPVALLPTDPALEPDLAVSRPHP